MRLSVAAFGLFLLWPHPAAAQDQSVGPCLPDQIRTTYHTGIAAGSLHIELTLTNVSDTTCILAGAPRVAAVSSAGNVVPVEFRWPAGGEDIEKGQESVALNPKGQVRLVIHTLDRTGFSKSDQCADGLRVYLPASPDSHPVARIVAESCREVEVSGYSTSN